MSQTVCTVIFHGQDVVAVLVVCAVCCGVIHCLHWVDVNDTTTHSAHHQDCHHILAMEYYSAYHLWHPLQDLFHPKSWQKPAAVTTVYSVPDDGRKGRPKHVELLTPNKQHKKVASRWQLYDQYVYHYYWPLLQASVKSSSEFMQCNQHFCHCWKHCSNWLFGIVGGTVGNFSWVSGLQMLPS